MNKSFDVELQVALRALNEVVAPALADAEKHVIEQLQLSIASIAFVKKRLPEARRYHRWELQAFMQIADEAAELARSDGGKKAALLDDLVATGGDLLADPAADLPDYKLLTRKLREHIALLSDRVQEKSCASALDRRILDRCGDITLQNRNWCLPFGVEVSPDDLPGPAWLE